MDLNTCFETTVDYHTIAYYSHLIPVFITVLLSIFALVKTKFSLLSKIFSLFAFSFCLWLVGDVITWTQNNYDLISLVWAPLDYINIIFYLSGTYFFIVLIKDKDLNSWYKLFFILLSLPGWWLTITNQTISVFNQPVCEALNNDLYMRYKLFLEVLLSLFVIFTAVNEYRKNTSSEKRKQIIIVSTALILFFGTFGITEYISGTTGIYEINLYSLFVLPVFLFMIIYSIVNLKVFNLRLIGTQLLAYLMIIMVGSQFFFLENATNQILTVVTFILSLSFGVLLVRDARKEIMQREEIERLAESLKTANQGQVNLIHFMNHQLKGRFGTAKNIFAELLTDDYGVMPETSRSIIQKGLEETNLGIEYVQSILKGASAENGSIPLEMKPINFKNIVEDTFNGQKEKAEHKNLKINLSLGEGEYNVNGDILQLSEAVRNLIDNSINYTPTGEIDVSLSTQNNKIVFKVNDTGVGLTSDDKSKLFKTGGRGVDSLKVNVNSTGYGLAFVKGVIEAHKGRVWAESEGRGKGSSFYIELPKS